MFDLLAGVKGDVLLTYNNTREIASLAAEFDFETQAIARRAAKHAKLDKLLIGKALSQWIKTQTANINTYEQHRKTR